MIRGYSRHFAELRNPWPIVDILLKEARAFRSQIDAWAKLLLRLCDDPQYAELALEPVWQVFLRSLGEVGGGRRANGVEDAAGAAAGGGAAAAGG
jgi:hypothetical protein